MTGQRRRIHTFIVLFVEMVALFLAIFGLYVRFSGVGNPAGVIYILIGLALGIGGSIPWLIASLQRKDKPKL